MFAQAGPQLLAPRVGVNHFMYHAHLDYHDVLDRLCIRCDMDRRRKVYEALSLYNGRPWLARGVSRGVWGIGCVLCAEYAASRAKSSGPMLSKLAKLQVRPTSGFRARWRIRQHQRCQSHRVACVC